MYIYELPLGRHKYKHAIPRGWDTPAFCTNLYIASTHLCVSLLQPPRGKYSLQAINYKELVCSEELSQQAWLRLLQSRALLFRDWSKSYVVNPSLSSSSSPSVSASSSSFLFRGGAPGALQSFKVLATWAQDACYQNFPQFMVYL